MTFDYVSAADGMAAGGLRMVVVAAVPSPWGEGAKGVFHVKGLEWSAIRLDHADADLLAWAGCDNAPAAVYNNERPRTGWAEILALAERLAPEPPLLPAAMEARVTTLGLAHEILSEGGLAWTRRLQLVEAGLRGDGGFIPRVATFLARKYGPAEGVADACRARLATLLDHLAGRLKALQAVGSPYYVGDHVTAADIYSATTLALYAPLPEAQCAMNAGTRAAFETPADPAPDPILLAHRDMMYDRHLETPLKL